MDWLILAKVTAVYFFILLILKFMGKREIGQLDLFDFVVILIIADIASIGIEQGDNFFIMLIAIIILAIIQKLFAYLLLKSPKIRSFIEGRQSFIVIDGKINIKEMRKQKYNMSDFIVQYRLKNIRSISEIKYAVLEGNGELSIFKYSDFLIQEKPNQQLINTVDKSNSTITSTKSSKRVDTSNPQDIYPFPLIVSGLINEDNLKVLNIDKEWLLNEIHILGYKSEKEIYYANYENNKLFIAETCDF